MAKAKRKPGSGWTASQVVAHNLTRARELRGLTQAEIAERLSLFTASPWSATTVAQAEGSVSGVRVRQFTANELAALARTFDLPIFYFFLPPEDRSGQFLVPDAGPNPWEYLLLLVWGHSGNFPAVADRAAPWVHASTILIPNQDMLEEERRSFARTILPPARDRLTPEDMLAVAFNGLARRRIAGSQMLGNQKQTPAATLRALADLIEAFDNYEPGAFFDTDELRDVARSRSDEPQQD